MHSMRSSWSDFCGVTGTQVLYAVATLPRPSAEPRPPGPAIVTGPDDQPTLTELDDLLTDPEPDEEELADGELDGPRGRFLLDLLMVVFVAAVIGSTLVLLLK